MTFPVTEYAMPVATRMLFAHRCKLLRAEIGE